MNSKINRDSAKKPVTLDSKTIEPEFSMTIEDKFEPFDVDDCMDLIDRKARRCAKNKKRIALLKTQEQDSILMASPVTTPQVTRN